MQDPSSCRTGDVAEDKLMKGNCFEHNEKVSITPWDELSGEQILKVRRWKHIWSKN